MPDPDDQLDETLAQAAAELAQIERDVRALLDRVREARADAERTELRLRALERKVPT